MEIEVELTPKRRMPWLAIAVLAVLVFVAVSILGPVFASAFQAARQVRTLSNFRMLHTSWIEYSVDYDDRACLASGWNETLIQHKGSRLTPEHLVNPMHRCGVFSECMDERQMGLNKALSGFSLRTGVEPSTLPVFSLTNLGGQDALATASSLQSGRSALVTLDGRVRFMSTLDVERLNWEALKEEGAQPRSR